MSVLKKILESISGNKGYKVSDQLLFDKVIGFKGVTNGVGVSTIVQNVAIALSETTNFSVCVVDTNFLFPVMSQMLASKQKLKDKDMLDFVSDISEVVDTTDYNNVYLLSLKNRNLVDLLSNKDSALLVERVINQLKTYFDIILIDLSNELTNISTHMAVKCNKIYVVTDVSLKSIYHLKKSLNLIGSLAIPYSKMNNFIINKVIQESVVTLKGVLEDIEANVVCEIPLEKDIALYGISGRRIWTKANVSEGINSMSQSIDTIIDTMLNTNPLLEKYISDSKNSKVSQVQVQGVDKNKNQNDVVDIIEDDLDLDDDM